MRSMSDAQIHKNIDIQVGLQIWTPPLEFHLNMNVNTCIQIIFNYWIICLPLMGCLRYGLVIGCLWLWFISSMAHIIFDLYRLWLGSDMTWHDYLRSVPLPWLSISKVKTAVEKPMHCFKNFTDFRRKYFPQGVHLFGGDGTFLTEFLLNDNLSPWGGGGVVPSLATWNQGMQAHLNFQVYLVSHYYHSELTTELASF